MRDVMRSVEVDIDSARATAMARIHREEARDEPNEDEENETAPDQPPSVNARPRVLVITKADTRKRVGAGSWSGSGELLVCVEALIPEEYLTNEADENAAELSAKHKAALEWASRLCKTVRCELQETSGRGDAQGNPYLNAENIDVYLAPCYPDEEEDQNYIAWIYSVQWR